VIDPMFLRDCLSAAIPVADHEGDALSEEVKVEALVDLVA
jgi:hypothetical protein